jgi:hypothetical protein
MSTFVNGTAVLRGVEVEVFSEIEVRRVDDSFDHEFGTEHQSHDEVEEIGYVTLDCDLRERAMDTLLANGWKHNRRRFLRWTRSIRRDVARLDSYSFWTEKQLDAAIERWEPPEPDYE